MDFITRVLPLWFSIMFFGAVVQLHHVVAREKINIISLLC